jgi:hypothetical protein
MLTDFYIAFSVACFSLLSLWVLIINFNAAAWLNSHLRWQAYAVALYFAAPGTMSLLALVFEQSTLAWRIIFIIVSAFGVLELRLFGPLHHQKPHGRLDRSDHLAHWAAIALYAAIAILAFIPRTLHAEGVLLTVLMLLGIHVALRLMFHVGVPRATDAQADAEAALPVLPVPRGSASSVRSGNSSRAPMKKQTAPIRVWVLARAASCTWPVTGSM